MIEVYQIGRGDESHWHYGQLSHPPGAPILHTRGSVSQDALDVADEHRPQGRTVMVAGA